MTTWLITGCSSGLGRAIAQANLDHGYAVVTARDLGSVESLTRTNPDLALSLALDVTDCLQMHQAVEQSVKRFGGIDVLVNSAGFGSADVSKDTVTPEAPVGVTDAVLHVSHGALCGGSL
jgi:NAD(P)-dependent dehydrogenase (short-subunit alcohol dehydrogenase family)